MALPHDLLEQASHLASREPLKPRQASLRRAVSSAYHALFHLLLTDAAKQCAPANPRKLRAQIQRAFEHGEMKKVCKSWGKGNFPTPTRQLLALPLDPPLVRVVKAFVDLQEARHKADYDLAAQWNRLDAFAKIQTAREAFSDWASTRTTPNSSVFMSALLFQRHWNR